MSSAHNQSLQEMSDVLGRHAHAFDEPESVQLMASVRAAGLLTDDRGPVEEFSGLVSIRCRPIRGC